MTLTPQRLIDLAAVAVATACVVMAVAVVAVKAARGLGTRARERRLAPLRPLVLVVATGEDTDDGQALERLVATTGRARRDVDDLAVHLLGKVRGEPAEQLVELLRRHGLLDRAVRGCRSRLARRRVRALHLLGRCRDAEGADLAIAALEDPSARVRSQAVRTVGRIGDPRAARPLLHTLRREDLHVGDAAEALVGLGFGVRDTLVWALAEGSPQARTVAAHLCGIGGVRAAAPLLVTLLETDEDPAVAAAAATALGAVGRPQDVGALAAASLHYFPLAVRRAALEALGRLGLERSVPVLLRHLEDPHVQVAEAAAEALVAVGPSGLEALREYSLVPAAGRALAMARLRGVLPR